jgi:hypothetical protein
VGEQPKDRRGGAETVVLALGDACIQTAAKRAHRELAAALLEGRAAASEAGAALETLARFLAATDFAALRAEHPELAGGIACRVRLLASADGAVRWELERSE